jgi:hypothetical protein
MKYLKINSEYQCSPLWVSSDGVVYENLDINASPFDESLRMKISDWAKTFENTLNQDYPPDSGFGTLVEEKQFEQNGFNIWKYINECYSDLYDKVFFYSYTMEKLYSNVSDYQKDLTNRGKTK